MRNQIHGNQKRTGNFWGRKSTGKTCLRCADEIVLDPYFLTWVQWSECHPKLSNTKATGTKKIGFILDWVVYYSWYVFIIPVVHSFILHHSIQKRVQVNDASWHSRPLDEVAKIHWSTTRKQQQQTESWPATWWQRQHREQSHPLNELQPSPHRQSRLQTPTTEPSWRSKTNNSWNRGNQKKMDDLQWHCLPKIVSWPNPTWCNPWTQPVFHVFV